MLKIKPVVLAVLGIMGSHAYAATADSNRQLERQIDQIAAQQKQLQAQVATLKQQLQQQASDNSSSGQGQTVSSDKSLKQAVHAYSFIRLGSYLDQEFTQNGSELVVNAPGVLAADAMLQQRYQENVDSKKAGYPIEDTPYMVFSGELEGQGIFSKNTSNKYTSDANLTDAELDMNPVMSKWVSGLFTIAYDKDINNYSSFENQDRVGESRLYVDKAFITLGNLMYSPYYGSIGQMYLPFGRYSYTTVSSPLTEDLARTKARAVSLGYYQNQDSGFGAHAYVFQASAGTANQQSKLQNFGLDSDYHFVANSAVSGDAGMGYINNIADSQGMLTNGSTSGFEGFGWGDSSYHLQKSVGAYDFHAKASYNQFAALTEYVTAASKFDTADLTYNGEGARPSALDLEGMYSFMAGTLPASFVLDYGFAREAAALNLPTKRYGSTVNFNVWTDTVLSLEYRHDIYAPADTTATGAGQSPGDMILGKSDNVVTAQLDMYF